MWIYLRKAKYVGYDTFHIVSKDNNVHDFADTIFIEAPFGYGLQGNMFGQFVLILLFNDQ